MINRRTTLIMLTLILALTGIVPAAASPRQQGLTDDQIATLNSLQQINDYPLYTMHYVGDYADPVEALEASAFDIETESPGWACSLFAALADEHDRLFGRNFDWQHSPALVLFTDPTNGYASVSLVDLEYFGFEGQAAQGIADLPLDERAALLDTPLAPFDGMNERGLAIGMAAVNGTTMPRREGHPLIGSIGIIRAVLDRAATVDEALAIFEHYDIEVEGGVPIHYLIADARGQAALVEFYRGEKIVTRSTQPWHVATNFICAAEKNTKGQCWRYDRITAALEDSGGVLSTADAMTLLSQVAQGSSTQWSVVYGLNMGAVQIATGSAYDQVEAFTLDMAGDDGQNRP
jgi:hypothetical protein